MVLENCLVTLQKVKHMDTIWLSYSTAIQEKGKHGSTKICALCPEWQYS
jgi:hypothetical protein